MDLLAFEDYLKKKRRSPNAINQILTIVAKFNTFLNGLKPSVSIDTVERKALDEFLRTVEPQGSSAAAKHLWGLRYYYLFKGNHTFADEIGRLREQRIKRTPFPLKKLLGIPHTHISKLAQEGISNVKQMLKAGKTIQDRKKLAEKTQIPYLDILELVKLSDLTRIPGVKGIRARLYFDAKEDTLAKLALANPVKLRQKLIAFVEDTQFNGIAPLPKEIQFTIDQAKSLPKIVDFEE